MGKLLASRRYNQIPLLHSWPGGVLRELAVQDLPAAKVATLVRLQILNSIKKQILL